MPVSVHVQPFSIQKPAMLTPGAQLSYATDAMQSAYNFMYQLGLTTSSFAPPVIEPIFPAVPSAPAAMTTTAPTLETVTVLAPTAPTPLAATLNIDALLPAPFDDTPPVLTFGTAPAAFSETAPAAPGVNVEFQYPDLAVSLPAAPSLLSISTRSFDGVTMPVIDENVPELIAVAPSLVQYTPGSGYASALLSNLQSKLLDRITNGGTGLNPQVEISIWNREREREAIAYQDAIDDLDRMEALGYAFPPGVYANARLKVNTEMRARTVSLGRDIAIKQAELEMQNVTQSLQIATQLEGQMMTYTNQVEQRLFESSKYATEAGIAIYNAKVQAYGAYLDAYKTKVAIYDAKIRGELAKVEAYKAAIAAEQAKAEINSALVSQYKTQSEVALSAIEVFKAQIGAIQAKAEIEKLKVEIFGEQVRAYTAKISAYTAGVEGFRASIQAEATKQEAYKNQVAAYAARVDAGVKAADAKIEEYKGRIAAKTAEWEGYKAAYAGEASRAEAIAAGNQNLVEGYKASVAAVTGYNETLTKQWQVALDQAQRTAAIGIEAARANAELYTTTRSLAMEASKVGAQVSAQIASAALNAVNYSYSSAMSYAGQESNSASFGASVSQGFSESLSESRQASTSVNTNYTYQMS